MQTIWLININKKIGICMNFNCMNNFSNELIEFLLENI